jgi:hypothetical protein
MTPTEVTDILRQFNGWRRDFDDKFEQPDPQEVSEAIDAAVEMIDRLEALPARITPEQAPAGVRDYCHEAAEGYADGWNACMRAINEETK